MKKTIMKKRVLYPLVFFGELAIVMLIARIFDLETENSLYGGICATLMALTIMVFFIKIIQEYKTKYPWVNVLYFPIFIITLMSIILWFVIIPNADKYLPESSTTIEKLDKKIDEQITRNITDYIKI